METNKETNGTNGAARDASIESSGAPTTGTLPKKTTFGAKVKRHCGRFWWLDFLIFAIIVLVIVLPIIYVGVPHKAQAEMNKAVVNVTNQQITDPKPDSVSLMLNTTVASHSSYTPTLDSFNASLFLESTEPDIKPFGYIQLPKVDVQSESAVNVAQEVTVADMDQFIAYNELVINSEEFRLAVRGRPGLKLGGLPKMHVNYNKVTTMKGLNKLAGFAITQTQILTVPAADGATLLGTVSIPNPSVVTVAMGNVTMDLSVAGTPIGTTLIQDLTLVPGSNNFAMRSYVNTTLVLGLVSSKYTDFVLPLDIVGNSSVNAAGEHLPYYEAAIKQNMLHFNLNLTTALAAIS